MSENESLVPVGELLRRHYLERMERNFSYSLRAFSRDLHLSHSHLSRVMTGKRNLSFKQAVGLANTLKLTEGARYTFLRQAAEQSTRLRKAKTTAVGPDQLTLQVDHFKLVSEWYTIAILELMALPDFQPKPAWIGRQLGVPARKIKVAAQRLARLGLIEISGEGWKRTHARLVVPSAPSAAIRAFHRQMIDKAQTSLTNDDPSVRDVTSITMGIDPKRIPEVRERIQKFRRSLLNFLEKDTPSALYQMNVQFFALTKTKSRKGVDNE